MERRDIATIIKKEARAKARQISASSRWRYLINVMVSLSPIRNGKMKCGRKTPAWIGMLRIIIQLVSDAKIIAARDVGSIAAKDCVLFLWTTNEHLRIAIGVMEAWSFEYKSNYCWGKNKISTGTLELEQA